MNTKKIGFSILIIIILLGLAVGMSHFQRPLLEQTKASVTSPNSETPATLAYLADFFNQNLGVLSPTKPTLGGTFHVTKVTAVSGAGTVSYEDGHNAYVADFLYSIDANRGIRVETFVLRK